jgi:hypothetical protein
MGEFAVSHDGDEPARKLSVIDIVAKVVVDSVKPRCIEANF